MTKEQILAMEAGRKLDATVGWEIFKELVHSDMVHIEEGIKAVKAYPNYSTDIEAAWSVVDKMFELGHSMSLLHLSSELDPDYWCCDFRLKGETKPPQYEWVSHIGKAPEAICKSALIAKLNSR